MQTAKRKISVSIDEDLVAELGAGEGSLSAKVNDAIREAVEHQAQQRLLGHLLDEFEAEEGPVEEALIQKYMRLLE